MSRKCRRQVPHVGDHADAAALLYAVLEFQTRWRFVVRGVRARIDVGCDKAWCDVKMGFVGPQCGFTNVVLNVGEPCERLHTCEVS